MVPDLKLGSFDTETMLEPTPLLFLTCLRPLPSLGIPANEYARPKC